eukprot:6488140-Amphidinium_carterae.3
MSLQLSTRVWGVGVGHGASIASIYTFTLHGMRSESIQEAIVAIGWVTKTVQGETNRSILAQ